MINIDVPELVKWIGYLSVIGGVLIGVWKLVKKALKFFDNLNKKLEYLIQETEEQGMAIKKLTVYNHELPLSERITAGKSYLKKGGNGDVKKYIEEHLLPYDIVKEDAK